MAGATKAPDFKFSKLGGDTFEITAAGGLGPSGTVKLNGVQLETTEWSTTRVVGKLPVGAKHGPVVVHVDDKVTLRGEFK